MADWGALVRGFQEGANFSQDFRAKRQFERRREQELAAADRDLAATAGNEADLMKQFPDATAGMTPFEFQPTFDEPMAYKLFHKIFKNKGKKKKTQALDLGGDSGYEASNPGPVGEASAPVEEYDSPEALGYADGGLTVDDLERLNRQQTRNARVEMAKDSIKRGASKVGETVRKAIPSKDGLLRRVVNSKAGRVGGALAVGSALLDQTDENADDRYAKRFGWDGPNEGEGDPSFAGFLKYFGKRGLGFASDLGDKLTFGGAGKLYRDNQEEAPAPSPQRTALPVEQPAAPEGTPGNAMQLSTTEIRARPSRAPAQSREPTFDFSDLDPTDVPDMKTDEWRQYRDMIIRDAARRGQPIDQVNDRITAMQQKNFLNYGQQGFALQQSGNMRGAMAAYRAAFQYFPNGNDVEFGLHKDPRTGRQQIVGFGKDEKTGKVVPGSEMLMDPERVGVLLENFKNPQAFRMWTKDWRDFQQQKREYEEVKKPLAQAQADYMANNSEANILRAENAGLRAGGAGGGGFKQSDSRAAQEMFSGMLMEQGVADPQQALELASIAIQLKQRQPQLSETQIIQMVLKRAGVIQ